MIYFDLVSGPGESSCDIVATNCRTVIPIDDFPESCTSFVFTKLRINEKHQVSFYFGDAHNGNYKKNSTQKWL